MEGPEIEANADSEFRGSTSLMLPISSLLCCREEWNQNLGDDDNDDDDNNEENISPITFHIAIKEKGIKLKFYCQTPSCGVLLPSEPSVPPMAPDGRMNPFFFEKGFGIESGTGFQVWPGSRLMLDYMVLMNEGVKNVLEIGSGIGVVGTCLAAVGHNVLVTDLPILVDHGIRPNLSRNKNKDRFHEEDAPDFFCESQQKSKHDDSPLLSNVGETIPVGKGWAAGAPLDWLQPVSKQLSSEVIESINFIIGCDCLFLRKLVDPVLTMAEAIFEERKGSSPPLLFTYERRNMMGVFISLEELLDRIMARNWKVECLAWRTIRVEGDGDHDLFLFKVMPSSCQ